MSKAVVYGKATCPWCVKAKELLTEKGVEYTEVIVDGVNFTRTHLVEAVGREVTTVPQIILDGTYIGGYTDLAKHYGVG